MTLKPLSVWIGYDPREAEAFAVCRKSIEEYHRHMVIRGVSLRPLQNTGLYYRPTQRKLGKLWDDISDAWMSTEFAISRFLVPYLAKGFHGGGGWAIFMDCDMLVRRSFNEMRPFLDDTKALCCVKHNYQPPEGEKMDGQVQTAYPRKNWSSVMAFNLDHPSNKKLTVEEVNSRTGRDLHRFCWLDDDEIGELPPRFNYLVGHTQNVADPAIVHFTEGGPWFGAFTEVEFADEWFSVRDGWVE